MKEIEILRVRQSHLVLSNYALAELSGINRSTIGRIYSGECIPSLSVYIALCDALGLKLTVK